MTCEQRGLPPPAHTKKGSYAANDWWRAKLAGLATAERDAEPAVVCETRRRADWLRQQGKHDEAEELNRGAEFVKRFPPAPVPRNADGLPVDPEIAVAEAVWADRLARTPAAESDTSVGRLATLYATPCGQRPGRGCGATRGGRHRPRAGPLRRPRRAGGGRERAGRRPLARVVRPLCRPGGPVARHDDGAAGGRSADTAAKFFGLSRTFVRWCYEREHLGQLPRNLASKGQKFERPVKTPPTSR